MFPYHDRQRTCGCLCGAQRGGEEDDSQVPEIWGKNDNTFPNHSPAVLHQTVFPSCQQFAGAVLVDTSHIARQFPSVQHGVQVDGHATDVHSRRAWVCVSVGEEKGSMWQQQYNPSESLRRWRLSCLVSASALPAAAGPASTLATVPAGDGSNWSWHAHDNSVYSYRCLHPQAVTCEMEALALRGEAGRLQRI